jgi:tRNA A37 threonylcarbamoyladenosine modification protein TsaB
LVENAAVDARHVVIVLDAKRGQIFTARYDRSPAGWAVGEEDHLDTLAAMLERSPRPVCLIGEGIPFHLQSIPASDDGIVIAAADRWQGQAAIVANLGWTMACKGEFTDPLSLVPIYIRRPEAEEKADAAMKLPQATSP